jgi:tRNA A37 methylthiotransferase MiaB
MKYFVKTFGCQQNVADSERVEARLQARGMTPAASYKDADHISIIDNGGNRNRCG